MEGLPAMAARPAQSLVSRSPEHTLAIGRALGQAAKAGSVIALEGALGAGKTQLAKGIAEGLQVSEVVNSPTFTLANEHLGRLPLFHIDAYRLSNAGDALIAGLLDERQAQGVSVIEWADRLHGLLPTERLAIKIDYGGRQSTDERMLRWRLVGSSHRDLAEVLRRGVEP